eukprot:gene2422-1525_t
MQTTPTCKHQNHAQPSNNIHSNSTHPANLSTNNVSIISHAFHPRNTNPLTLLIPQRKCVNPEPAKQHTASPPTSRNQKSLPVQTASKHKLSSVSTRKQQAFMDLCKSPLINNLSTTSQHSLPKHHQAYTTNLDNVPSMHSKVATSLQCQLQTNNYHPPSSATSISNTNKPHTQKPMVAKTESSLQDSPQITPTVTATYQQVLTIRHSKTTHPIAFYPKQSRLPPSTNLQVKNIVFKDPHRSRRKTPKITLTAYIKSLQPKSIANALSRANTPPIKTPKPAYETRNPGNPPQAPQKSNNPHTTKHTKRQLKQHEITLQHAKLRKLSQITTHTKPRKMHQNWQNFAKLTGLPKATIPHQIPARKRNLLIQHPETPSSPEISCQYVSYVPTTPGKANITALHQTIPKIRQFGANTPIPTKTQNAPKSPKYSQIKATTKPSPKIHCNTTTKNGRNADSSGGQRSPPALAIPHRPAKSYGHLLGSPPFVALHARSKVQPTTKIKIKQNPCAKTPDHFENPKNHTIRSKPQPRNPKFRHPASTCTHQPTIKSKSRRNIKRHGKANPHQAKHHRGHQSVIHKPRMATILLKPQNPKSPPKPRTNPISQIQSHKTPAPPSAPQSKTLCQSQHNSKLNTSISSSHHKLATYRPKQHKTHIKASKTPTSKNPNHNHTITRNQRSPLPDPKATWKQSTTYTKLQTPQTLQHLSQAMNIRNKTLQAHQSTLKTQPHNLNLQITERSYQNTMFNRHVTRSITSRLHIPTTQNATSCNSTTNQPKVNLTILINHLTHHNPPVHVTTTKHTKTPSQIAVQQTPNYNHHLHASSILHITASKSQPAITVSTSQQSTGRKICTHNNLEIKQILCSEPTYSRKLYNITSQIYRSKTSTCQTATHSNTCKQIRFTQEILKH